MRYSENFQGLFSCQTQEVRTDLIICSSLGKPNLRLAYEGFTKSYCLATD